MTLAERLTQYEKLMRLDKPIGILLLLWPTLWGLWFAAGGMPPPRMPEHLKRRKGNRGSPHSGST